MAKDFSPSPPPLTPPLTEEVKLDWLRLLRSRRVGPTTFHRLLSEHGSAAAALAALPDIAHAAGVAKYQPCTLQAAEDELLSGARAGARLVACTEADYPPLLRELPDAPPLLWAMGDLSLLARPMVAMVGARSASSLGIRMARKLAAELSGSGFVVVSGLARGIDTEAHKAALQGGTIAVMAGGVDVVYPAQNTVLAQEISETGLRLAEQPMHMTPQARHFPMRNRIISGLCRAVIVVEAAAKSGSLITARNALDQGRDVLAVPGHPFDARAAGCNMLIRDGATLARSAADVAEALADPPGAPAGVAGPAPTLPPERPARDPAEIHRLHTQILGQLGPSPLAEDQLIRDLGQPAGEVAPEILTLELEGRIARDAGGLLSRIDA
ncbi:MAG: DNA-protecting protein DprA [Rhodobacteraceae bacterium]|nr:DNA-protecting protein DprA [Paracoccaceae bacterium]